LIGGEAERAVGIAVGVAQRVVGEERERGVQLAAHADAVLTEVLRARRLELIYVALRRVGSHAARERRVYVARAQEMSRVVGEHEARQRDLLRQLSFDDEAGRVGVWRCDVGRERARDLRQREGVQLLGGRRVGEATEYDACLLRARGIVCREWRGDDELLLVDAVEAERVERQVFGDAVVEYAEAEAYDGLRRLLRAAVGRPSDVEARRKIKMAADVRLRLVAKAVADREVRAHLPVVLQE